MRRIEKSVSGSHAHRSLPPDGASDVRRKRQPTSAPAARTANWVAIEGAISRADAVKMQSAPVSRPLQKEEYMPRTASATTTTASSFNPLTNPPK